MGLQFAPLQAIDGGVRVRVIIIFIVAAATRSRRIPVLHRITTRGI